MSCPLLVAGGRAAEVQPAIRITTKEVTTIRLMFSYPTGVALARKTSLDNEVRKERKQSLCSFNWSEIVRYYGVQYKLNLWS